MLDNKMIEQLREALALSPNNVVLKKHLADMLMQHKQWKEAKELYSSLLSAQNNRNSKYDLAAACFELEEFSQAIILLETILDTEGEDIDTLVLYTRCLVKDQSLAKAIETYKKIQQIDPQFSDAELDGVLKATNEEDEIDLDDYLEDELLEKPVINFDDVGGMEKVKNEIDLKIIKPMEHADLYAAYGKKIGGGMLLYGPPGCGKTYIARATAGQINAKFISVGLNDILDMWIGNSEKNLHELFQLARRNTPCVLFIDEIDALGASRNDMKSSGGRQLVNQFLQELDGVDSSNEGILVLAATNTPWHLDPAFRRPGRFDRILFVPPPDQEGRETILKIKLKDKPTAGIEHGKIAQKTDHYSGADLEAIIDLAIEAKLEQSFKTGIPEPLKTKDFLAAIKKHKASTQEWFATARNFALYANDSGLYDDILKHLKIKK